MEFGEKLQKLRKSRGLTQEELAENLYVSRTAVSKWESGRGYPNIDSLKQIAVFFGVTVDDLLSGERLLNIAEKENKSDIRNICDLFSGFADVLALLFIILPLYPDTVNGFIYSVNLIFYNETTVFNLCVHWILFGLLVVFGIIRIILTCLHREKYSRPLFAVSVTVNIVLVLFLALAREAYAVVAVFLLLTAKVLIHLRYIKAG